VELLKMPRKDGVRGNSKKTDNYANSNYRHAHSDAGTKGGKKTSKALIKEHEVAMLTTPFFVGASYGERDCDFCGCPLVESMENGKRVWRCPNADCPKKKQKQEQFREDSEFS
jgi:hypothetical protein